MLWQGEIRKRLADDFHPGLRSCVISGSTDKAAALENDHLRWIVAIPVLGQVRRWFVDRHGTLDRIGIQLHRKRFETTVSLAG